MTMMTIPRLVLLVGLAGAALPSTARAQNPPPDLSQVSIEELMEIRVTSAARKSQRAEDVPAAVYVISRQDIRRSGLVSLPEILRLAPGVQVARASSAKWAISIRGFNDVYSNKLLVLVDGRSIYTRTFSGVFWDLHEVMVDDIERIEVIRGPGGAVWGANAVNGIVNIITRPASATKGLALDASLGTLARHRLGVRYGGSVGSAAYRVFSQWSGFADAAQIAATPYDDRWHSLSNGARVDWSRGADAIMTQAHVTTNTTRPGWRELPGVVPGIAPVTDGVSRAAEASVLGRWTRTRAAGGVLQVQGFHTATHRDERIIDLREHISDVDAQYEMTVGARHGLVLGGGYRHVRVAVQDSFTMHIGPDQTNTFNTFLQDQIVIRPNVTLTLGSRLEHDTFGGWDLSPSARVMWEATPGHHLWGAVSRTRRTPALIDQDLRINLEVVPGPGLPIVVGYTSNAKYASERFVQAEAGYRVRIAPRASVDATVFTGSYRGLPTYEPMVPTVSTTPAPMHLLAGVTAANLLDARSSGVEIQAEWSPLAQWQVDASYSRLHVTSRADPASLDRTAAGTDGKAPAHQWQLRSTTSLRPGIEIGGSVARVGALRRLGVPAYTRVDARAQFRLNRHLILAAVGENLASAQHQEFATRILYLTSGMPRSARLDLRWEF